MSDEKEQVDNVFRDVAAICGGSPVNDTITFDATTDTSHPFEPGDVIRISFPRPPWWRPVALWQWWLSPLRSKLWRVADVTATTFNIV